MEPDVKQEPDRKASLDRPADFVSRHIGPRDEDVGEMLSELGYASLDELSRVTVPGGQLAIGTWGGRDWEGVSDRDSIAPPRFFSLRSHERWRRRLSGRGSIEREATWQPDPASTWEYQFAVIRSEGPGRLDECSL